MSNAPTIIFVNRYYKPDLSATAQILTTLTEGLAARGHRVVVVTSRQLYGDASAKLPHRETLSGVDVIRVKSTRFGRKNLGGRLFDYLTFGLSAQRTIKTLAQPGDWVVAKTDPPNLASALDGVVKKRGAKLLVWCQDLFPEVAAPITSQAERPPAFVHYLMKDRDLAYKSAQAVITISSDMRNYLANRGLRPEALPIIPNWCVPPDMEAAPEGADNLREQWGLQGKFVIGYSGNLGRVHDYGTFVSAMQHLKFEQDIRFLFIGSGRQEEMQRELPEEVRRLAVFKPYQPLSHLAQSLSTPDVHLVSLRPSQSRFVYPSKFYGILAVGKPVLMVGDPQSAMAQEIVEQGIGTCVQEGDGAALAQEILRLRDHATLRESMARNARNRHETAYTFQQRLADWERLLALPSVNEESLISAKPSH